jgi:hypothetical protein
MRWAVGLLPLLLTGCLSSSAAYRAHFGSSSEVEGLKACAAACDEASSRGEDVQKCLESCPGFTASVGDRCQPSNEQPGTYCVTVETRIYPDLAFWASAAESVAEASSSDDDDDDDASSSSASSERAKPHRAAEPRASSERRSEPKTRAR